MAYPTTDSSADEVVRCMKEFMGRRKIRVAYGDYAPQFVSACQQLGITFDHSLPGRPMNNSLVERNNLYVIDQGTCLLAAGLPPCYWCFALASACHLLTPPFTDSNIPSSCTGRIIGAAYPLAIGRIRNQDHFPSEVRTLG